MIGREEDARDVCQETFLRAFRALRGFRGQAKFSVVVQDCAQPVPRLDSARTPRANRAGARGVDLLDLAAEQEPAESIETRCCAAR